MYGAIYGDIAGSIYEFNNKKFELGKKRYLLGKHNRFTDDTVMTVAIADAMMCVNTDMSDDEIKGIIVDKLKTYGRMYPKAGYGRNFINWIFSDDSKPYYSCGNGSAMRVSPVAYLFNDIRDVKRMARLTAEVTHNHPEGIKGAEAIAVAIFMARHSLIEGISKTKIFYDVMREYYPNFIEMDFDPYSVLCQDTVPLALISFYYSDDFSQAIISAITRGGDTDTCACITGAIAEAYYYNGRLPKDTIEKICKWYCKDDIFKYVFNRFNDMADQREREYYIAKKSEA